jgi:hypothetical protein
MEWKREGRRSRLAHQQGVLQMLVEKRPLIIMWRLPGKNVLEKSKKVINTLKYKQKIYGLRLCEI